MKQISINNGMSFVTPAEALDSIDIETMAIYMVDDIRDQVHAELAPCTDLEFLTRYLALSDDNLIIG